MIPFTTIILRLSIALLLGAFIGAERESREHAAGLRTNALVSLGSALFMIISAYGFTSFTNVSHMQIDPSRIASYVVAGIGFLGGGTIFMNRDKDHVKGLTTAATVWVVSAIGLACGIGLLLEAAAGTFMVLLILIALRFTEPFFPVKQADTQDIWLEVPSATGQLIGNIYDICTHRNIHIKTIKTEIQKEKASIHLICFVPSAEALVRVAGQLSALPEVLGVHTDLRSPTTRKRPWWEKA